MWASVFFCSQRSHWLPLHTLQPSVLLFTPCGFQKWFNESIITGPVGKRRKMGIRYWECLRPLKSSVVIRQVLVFGFDSSYLLWSTGFQRMPDVFRFMSMNVHVTVWWLLLWMWVTVCGAPHLESMHMCTFGSYRLFFNASGLTGSWED